MVVQFVVALGVVIALMIVFATLLGLWVPDWVATRLAGGRVDHRHLVSRILLLALTVWLMVALVEGCVP